MHRIKTLLITAAAVTACGGKSTPKPATPLTELVITQVREDLSTPNPDAEYWNEIAPGIVTLMAQPMIAPRPETTTTENVHVQAIHDGTNVAFRLTWKDPEKSEAGRLGEFSDALALQFPLRDGAEPPIMMGGQGMPVHILHWRAQYQRDEEHGKPETADLYPNGSTDMYALEPRGVDAGPRGATERYNPAVALGNPQAYRKSAVDEIYAEGFATSAVQEGHGQKGKAVWRNGEWALVIVRPMRMEGGSSLRPGAPSKIAFAIWQGGHEEVGSRKCITMQWTPVTVR